MIHALYNHSIWSWLRGALYSWSDSIQEALIIRESEETTDGGSVGGTEVNGTDATKEVGHTI